MDASAVDRLRAALSGTGWVERAASLARSLRSAGHDPGGLLLVGTPDEEPWHLAAHLDDEARYGRLPELMPTLVRWAPPPGAPPHLAVSLDRLGAITRGETLFVVAPDLPPEHLLERVADARRGGATVLALDGVGSDLADLAHDALVVRPDADAPASTPSGTCSAPPPGRGPPGAPAGCVARAETGGRRRRRTPRCPVVTDVEEPRAGVDPLVRAEAPKRTGLRSLAIDTGPLRRHREYRLLFTGQVVTFFGSLITYVAIPYQVYTLTHSSFAVGMLGLVEFVCMISMAFLAGALADSVDRRRMVQVTELAMLGVSALLLVNALAPHPSVALLFVAVGLTMTFDALQRPSLDALLPRLVPREDVLAAGALNSMRGTAGMIAGPAVGGILISTIGLASTYAVDVVSFAISLAVLARMQAVPPPPDAERPSLRGVAEGIRFARSRPELMGTYLVDINAMFFGMPNALFPALAVGYGGVGVLGLLYSAPAVGALLASALSGWTARVHHHGQAVLWAAGVWGTALLGFGLSSWLWLALLFLILAGAADMISGLFRMTIWNTTIPDHLRGRLAGIELISYSTGPTLGNVEAGGVAAFTSPRFSAGLGGGLCVIGTLALAVALPAFRGYDARETP